MQHRWSASVHVVYQLVNINTIEWYALLPKHAQRLENFATPPALQVLGSKQCVYWNRGPERYSAPV